MQEPHKVEVRLYDKLFKSEQPNSLDDWLADLNPDSLKVTTCFVEPSLKSTNFPICGINCADAKVGDAYQFERVGFFCVDKDSTPQRNVWNRIVTLKEAKWGDEAK